MRLPMPIDYCPMFTNEQLTERISKIEILMLRSVRGRVATFKVDFLVPGSTYFYKEFKIRDSNGNLTDIGRKMGMQTRDKRISIYSPKGIAIEEYLHRLSVKYAGALTKGKVKVEDNTPYSKSQSQIGVA